jgi:hypothetical protein
MNWRFFLFLPLSVGAVQSASGAWLGVCNGELRNPTAKLLAEYVSPQKLHTALLLDTAPLPDCAALELPFAPEAVITGRLISSGLNSSMVSGFALTGRMQEQQFHISEIVPYFEKDDTSSIPLGVELIDQLGVRAFGVEGRASATLNNRRITLDCTAGNHAAGMILRMPYRGLPHTIPMSIPVSYKTNGEFEFGLSDTWRTSVGDPLTLLKLSAATTTLQIDVPNRGLDLDRVESFTVACPMHAAKFELGALKIEPKTMRPPLASRALWIWQSDAWMQSPEALLNKLPKAQVDTLYVNVPIDVPHGKVAHPHELEIFVNAATQQGVRIWAVVGDPGAVIESERAVFARYPVAYADYNSTVPVTAQLTGVQFDIEPYLNPGYSLDPAAWYEAYLETLRQLKHDSTLPIDIALPYWWANQQTSGGGLMDRLAPFVDSVTVMNYRTDPIQIKRFAQPLLEWGVKYHRSVRIALESGPIPDEVQHHFHPASPGEIALISISSHHVMLEFDRALSISKPDPTVRTFHFSHVTPIPGSSTTFAGRHDALLKLLPELERQWSAWPSFSGSALHEFEP